MVLSKVFFFHPHHQFLKTPLCTCTLMLYETLCIIIIKACYAMTNNNETKLVDHPIISKYSLCVDGSVSVILCDVYAVVYVLLVFPFLRINKHS